MTQLACAIYPGTGNGRTTYAPQHSAEHRAYTVHTGLVMIAAATALLVPHTVAAQEALDNVEIRMVKSSSGGPTRVTAETRNPNDFAVRDVEMNCTIKDRAGKDVASYRSTVLNIFQPNERKTTQNLDVGAWPEHGYAALCISIRGVRVPPAAAPQ